MKITDKFDFKTLLVAILSLCLCFSFTFAACGKPDDQSSSSSSSKEEEEEKDVFPTDVQKITNGDFEFSTFKKEAKDFPVYSSVNWVRTYDTLGGFTASSSSLNSGIIDTDDEVYKKTAKENTKAGFPKIKGEDGKETEDYYNPHTPGYYGLVKDSFVRPSDEDLRDKTEASENKDKLPMQGSKILMIHNVITNKEGQGTAQKFTGPSFTLERGKYARVSVWVNTYELANDYEDGVKGAYIAVKNTIKSQENDLVIKNIDTDGNWVKYSFCLEPSDIAKSEYKLVLGLGFGSSELKDEYVEGYAYFDNVTYEEIDKADYEASLEKAEAEFDIFTADNGETDKESLIQNEEGVAYEKTNGLEKSDAYDENRKFSERVFALSHVRPGREAYDAELGDNDFVWNKFDLTEAEKDFEAKISKADKLDEDNLKEVNPDLTLPENNAGISGNALFFATNENGPTSYTYTTDAFDLKEDGYIILNFMVIADLKATNPSGKGLSVTLNDLGLAGSGSDAIKTVIVDNLKSTKTEKKEDEEQKTEWKEYTLLVSNNLNNDKENEETRSFTLTFDFGTTAKTAGLWDRVNGYAVVAGLNGQYLSEDDYNLANIADAKKVGLKADLKNGPKEDEEAKDDSYKFNYGASFDLGISTDVATYVDGYKPVKGGTKAVGGDKKNDYDKYANAGIINTQYLDNYKQLDDDTKAALEKLDKIGENKYLQPLMISNKEADSSIGFVGQKATFAKNTTTLISFKVFVTGDAKAYFYLVDPDARDGFKTVAVRAIDYELGKDGKPAPKENEYKVDRELSIELEKTDKENWFIARFVIKTGDHDIAYRPEFWNGSRDNAAHPDGIVFFDDYKAETKSAEQIEELEKELELDGDKVKEEISYEQMPDTVTCTKDGADVVEYRKHKASVVFKQYENSKVVFADYTAIVDESVEKDERKPEEKPDESKDGEKGGNDFRAALEISSIIIAVVLILLLVVVIIRVMFKKHNKKKSSAVSYYNRSSRDETMKNIESKKSKPGKKAKQEPEKEPEHPEKTVKPYDYDNPEKNIESDDDKDGSTEEK